MVIYWDPNIAVWQILHLYSVATQSINRALAHTLPTNPLPPSSHTNTHTHHPTNHAPPYSPETQSGVEPKAGWLEQQDMLGTGFVINISLFQMVPPTMQKDTTTGPADREGPCFGGKDKINRKTQSWIKHLFSPWRWKARWQLLDTASYFTHLWYYSSFHITLFIVQSHHSSLRTSIMWQLS